ncbi:hypothetical protein IQ229_13730 [Nostoc cf. edaphicum LEGE 07299]|uniref:Uncharacterized protein n=1 Tax=Nostoc cf. edaphicum LEGE 07299 TaxID=2777974 RepID=A0ABR9U0R8_9NOSO|nr:hypothetical protein [Nostoc edaphicum]MBE9105957.1 hypothetical protein [Nostoc cf. edaphicum LEGE 07299]
MSITGNEARTTMEKQATRSIFERKRLAKISLKEAFAIAIGNATSRKNSQWVLTYQGSELSGSVIFFNKKNPRWVLTY